MLALIPRFAVSLIKAPIVGSLPMGPGPQTLIAGDATAGYYGQVSSQEMLAGMNLAADIGLTEGVAINPDSDWLKFSFNNKILFIPKKSIRRNVSWQAIYQAGAVYGLIGALTTAATVGRDPLPAGSPKAQTTRVVPDTGNFRVRLATGGNVNPWATNEYNVQNPASASNSEWSKLLHKVSAADPSGTYWERFSNEELGIVATLLDWTQETHPYAAGARALRGYNSVSGMTTDIGSVTTSWYAPVWRPVLEFLSPLVIQFIANSVVQSPVEIVGPLLTDADGLRFPGSKRYLTVPINHGHVFGTRDFTIDSDFKIHSIVYANITPLIYWGFYVQSGNLTTYDLYYNHAAGSQGFNFNCTHVNGTAHKWSCPFTLVLGQMYNVQVTREAGMMQLWVNGMKIGESAFPEDIQLDNPTNKMSIGYRSGGTDISSFRADMSVKNLRIAHVGRTKLLTM